MSRRWELFLAEAREREQQFWEQFWFVPVSAGPLLYYFCFLSFILFLVFFFFAYNARASVNSDVD